MVVIFLNGTSSSGKTSLARELQAAWTTPLVYLALDTFIGMLPFKYTGQGEKAAEGFELFPAGSQGEVLTGYRMGRFGHLLNHRMAELARGLASDGLDVVIDHVLIDEDSYAPFPEALAGYAVWLIGVRCEIEETERREQQRDDRFPGLSRFQHSRVHWARALYDFEVDSTQSSPGELSREVIRRLESGTPRFARES